MATNSTATNSTATNSTATNSTSNNEISLTKDEKRYLIQFCIKNGDKISKVIPDEKNKGLPVSFLETIPGIRIQIEGRFKEMIKIKEEKNNEIQIEGDLTMNDLIIYLKYKKLLNDKKIETRELENKELREREFGNKEIQNINMITKGSVIIAEKFYDIEYMLYYSKKISDYDALMCYNEDMLSQMASDYLERVFNQVNVKNIIEDIKDYYNTYRMRYLASLQDVKNYEIDHFKEKEKGERIMEKLIKELIEGYNDWDPTYEREFTEDQKQLGTIEYENDSDLWGIPQRKVKKYVNCERVWDYLQEFIKKLKQLPNEIYEEVIESKNLLLSTSSNSDDSESNIEIDINKHETTIYMLDYFRTLYEKYWYILQHIVGVYKERQHYSEKTRLFVNKNPGMARVIWETEEFRNTLIMGYLKVSNRKLKRYKEAAFEELIDLVEDRDESDLYTYEMRKYMFQNATLKELYKRYNLSIDNQQRVTMLQQIKECKEQLAKDYKKSQEKEIEKRKQINRSIPLSRF